MWHLKSISARNLCSFVELDYTLKQGEATLVFGHNNDSESQNSNGSGKSALMEAISIALTGDPLRKVCNEEIINDSAEEANVTAVLYNDMQERQMTIMRLLRRRKPQIVHVLQQTGPYDSDIQRIDQANVADYNKYILDQLGLTKDDIFGNFILTARKYKSFLACPDKEKKELINRLSNGILVDESIQSIQDDIAPIQDKYNKAEKNESVCLGKVEALGAEIERVLSENECLKSKNEQRIKEWEDMIASKRSEIRKAKKDMEEALSSLRKTKQADSAVQDLEDSDKTTPQVLQAVVSELQACGMALTTDFEREINALNNEMEQAEKEVAYAAKNVAKLKRNLNIAESTYSQAKEDFEIKEADNAQKNKECDKRLTEILFAVDAINKTIVESQNIQASKQRQLAHIEKQLAGVIQCPKCSHEFAIDPQVDIAEARENLKLVKEQIDKLTKTIASNEISQKKLDDEMAKQRQEQVSLNQEITELHRTLNIASNDLVKARQEYVKCEAQIEHSESRYDQIKVKMNRLRKQIFDEAYEALDISFRQKEQCAQEIRERVHVSEGTISSYEKAIEQARKFSEDEMIETFKQRQMEYKNDLKKATAKLEEIKEQLNILKSQEAAFVEFKTYLANTKINAIAQITNEFLETIGSDIRVSMSGYTVLRSGKIREKISVSLLRDGVDCGSFEKFSAGERVRVELASVLSMNKLTNLNCEEGKGLDLLIADEILDSADETGLASVFAALNKTQVTSLVVSHGLVSEGYPNKITVVKSNGISTIKQ